MIWENSAYLWLLLLLPVLYGLYWWYRRYQARKRETFFDERLISQLRRNYWRTGDRTRLFCMMAALFFFIVAAAGPKIGTEVREIQRRGVNMLVALDLSRSMNAEDINPSRLEKAKFEVGRLINRLQGDRVGLVVFTGEAFVQAPLTTDYSALRLFLDIANTDQMPTGATNFRAAMVKASEAFDSIEDQNNNASDVLLFISDGENHQEGYESALEELTDRGVIVFSIGVGTREGGPIPVFNPNNPSQQMGYHRDSEGSVVTTRLEPDVLREIANTGGGEYFEIRSGNNSIEPFFSRLDELERGEFTNQEFADYKNQYQVLLLIGLAFFGLALFFPESRKSTEEPGPYSS